MNAIALPGPFWFRFALRAPRLDSWPPRTSPSPSAKPALPAECLLPALPGTEERASWLRAGVAWHPEGLACLFQITGKPRKITAESAASPLSDGVDLWIDTRDARDIHRATRYCHHFRARLAAPARGSPLVRIDRPPINRSVASPPAFDPRTVQTLVDLDRSGWTLLLLLSAKALHGFDPEVNRRFGFAYEVHNALQGAVSFPVGRDFPIAEDPSLWCTLELTDVPLTCAHAAGMPAAPEPAVRPAPSPSSRRPRRSPRGTSS